MYPLPPSANKANLYLMKQKEKWNRYQQQLYQANKQKKSPIEIARIKQDLHCLENQLVQVKRISHLIDKTKARQQSDNNLDVDTLTEVLKELTEASSIALDSERWYVFYEEQCW